MSAFLSKGRHEITAALTLGRESFNCGNESSLKQKWKFTKAWGERKAAADALCYRVFWLLQKASSL